MCTFTTTRFCYLLNFGTERQTCHTDFVTAILLRLHVMQRQEESFDWKNRSGSYIPKGCTTESAVNFFGYSFAACSATFRYFLQRWHHNNWLALFCFNLPYKMRSIYILALQPYFFQLLNHNRLSGSRVLCDAKSYEVIPKITLGKVWVYGQRNGNDWKKASISLKTEEMTKSRDVKTRERRCPVWHKHTRGIPELG